MSKTVILLIEHELLPVRIEIEYLGLATKKCYMTAQYFDSYAITNRFAYTVQAFDGERRRAFQVNIHTVAQHPTRLRHSIIPHVRL
jgi:hypothetical protein